MLARSFRKAHFCCSSLVRVKCLHCGENLRWKLLAVIQDLCSAEYANEKEKKDFDLQKDDNRWHKSIRNFTKFDVCLKSLITVFAIQRWRLKDQKFLQNYIKAQWLTYGQSFPTHAKFLFLLSEH